MSDEAVVANPGERTVNLGMEVLPFVGASDSPIIFFELVPTSGHIVGLIDICLVVTRTTVGVGGQTIREAVVAANLRCTKIGAIELRNAINAALFLLEPVENPEGKAN